MVKQDQQLFAFDDVELEFTQEALVEIAEKAIARNTGARGLRGIMEHVLRRAMFDVPSRENVERCIVNADLIRGEAEIQVVERQNQEIQPLLVWPVNDIRHKKGRGQLCVKPGNVR